VLTAAFSEIRLGWPRTAPFSPMIKIGLLSSCGARWMWFDTGVMSTSSLSSSSTGRGSAGNVLAAICSVFIPGLGQLVQGRLLKALLHVVLWVPFLGLGMITFGLGTALWHIWSAYEASRWTAEGQR
jgi:TM2 domain-containing membrane protein YozV